LLVGVLDGLVLWVAEKARQIDKQILLCTSDGTMCSKLQIETDHYSQIQQSNSIDLFKSKMSKWTWRQAASRS